MSRVRLACLLTSVTLAASLPAFAGGGTQGATVDRTARSAHGQHAHRQVPKRQVGKASIYAHKFAGRTMANGRRMDPADGNAASKTLPLGTTARVTNLENGRSTVVRIEDRGPHVPGRIVDLSPGSASEIGVTRKQGLALVEVQPLSVPTDAASSGANGTQKE
jgi:rare lipoprotein A